MGVVDDSYANPMKLEEGAVAPLAGGLLQHGYQCGMLWGAALAAGARAYRLYSAGPQAEAEALLATQRLVETFRARNRHINCFEITEMEWQGSNRQMLAQVVKFFLKGGPLACFSMSASFARAASKDLQVSFTGKHEVAACEPQCCTALLARKMGASDLHATMAAGLAGGLGLSGGACGALGAAVWLHGLRYAQAENRKVGLDSPELSKLVERFLKTTGYEFECSKIAGMRFESASEHAAYLHAGGCMELIDALAA